MLNLPRPRSQVSTKGLPRFAELRTDVAKLIKKLKEEKVTGIILDLRRNGGGSLEEAISLTGLFIKEGPVVQVQDPNGNPPTVDEDRDPTVLGMRAMADALRAAGASVRQTEYRGVGHNSWDRAYSDAALIDWMLAQKRR